MFSCISKETYEYESKNHYLSNHESIELAKRLVNNPSNS